MKKDEKIIFENIFLCFFLWNFMPNSFCESFIWSFQFSGYYIIKNHLVCSDRYLSSKQLPSKHSSWWRRTEDVFRTSSRRHQCNIFLSSKTSWRRLQDIIAICLANTSWRCLEDVLKTFEEDILQIRLEDVFKTSSRRLGRRKVLRWRRLHNVLKTSWKTRNVCWV